MADATPVVASAVIVPEAEDLQVPDLKRRPSSSPDTNSKRRRLSQDDPAQQTKRVDSGRHTEDGSVVKDKVEERKRGRRLFGALLGTLSQSSSSTAQNRRNEIERRQQAKLRQQAEEQDEAKKEKFEALFAARRKESGVYAKQSMKIRHSNLRSQAQFLQTKAKPRLFYKPWELLPEEEERIKESLKQVEITIETEVAQREAEEQPREQSKGDTMPQEERPRAEQSIDRMELVRNELENQEPSGTDIHDATTNDAKHPSPTENITNTNAQEPQKDQTTEGEEVVEGEEDTVIY